MRKLKLIVIENDEDEQFFIQKGFESSGLFEITAMAFNGADFFKILNNADIPRPDAILSDLNMYGMDGYDVLEELKRNPQFDSIPVIISSNVASSTIIDKCKRLGAYTLKVKPDNFNSYEDFAKSLYSELISTIYDVKD